MSAEELVIGLLINIIVGVVVGWGFYRLGLRRARQQADDLVRLLKQQADDYKNFVSTKLVPYANQLRHAINTLEGKNVEGEGRIVVDHDTDGNPTAVRIAPPQIINMEGLSSESALGVPTVEIGPPPTPPPSVGKDLSLSWSVDETPREQDEVPSSENR